MNAPAQTRTIERSIEINAPAEAVWKALMDAEELTRWFPLEAGENPDGTVWMGWRDQFRFSGRVEALEPQKYMRSVPVFPPGFTPPVKMATEFRLEARGSNTLVRVVQSGFLADAAWDQEYDGTDRGWLFQLRGLKHYLEHHRGTPRHVAWARQLIAVPTTEAWQRVMSAKGVLAEGKLEGLREGDSFSFRTADGDRFEGCFFQLNAGRDFSGTVANWNNAIMRIQFDDLPARGYRDAQLWISTYGVPAADVAALERRWKGMLQRLFPEPAPQPKMPGA